MIRIGQDLYRLPFIGKLLGFIVEYIIRVVYASDISCRANIGPGLSIIHGHDIVIGGNVVISARQPINARVPRDMRLSNMYLSLLLFGNIDRPSDASIIIFTIKIIIAWKDVFLNCNIFG